MRPCILFKVFLQLLFVIFQIHYGFLGKFKIPFELPFGPLDIHPDLLLLFQRALQLTHAHIFSKILKPHMQWFPKATGHRPTSSTCCSSLILALVRELTLSSSACRSSSVCWWASWSANFSLDNLAMVSSREDISSVRFFTWTHKKK